MTTTDKPVSSTSTPWYEGRLARRVREALQAYLFLLPGTLILLSFSLLPIGYAFYISLHKWRIRKGDYIGFENFLRALGEPLDILYVVGGLILLGASWLVWRRIQSDTSTGELIWRVLLGAMLIVAGFGLFLGFPQMLEHGDEDLFKSLGITFMYSMGTVPFQIALSFILAFILFQDIKGKTMWRIIYFLPYVTVTVASAAMWQSIFDPGKGVINRTLMSLGMAEKELPRWLFDATRLGVYVGERVGVEVPQWLGGPSMALVAVIIYNIWTYVGYNAVIYLAGLGNIPSSLYEAAKIDGASRWQQLLKITIPLVSPTTYFLVMMGILGTFRAFNHIYVMTNVVGPVGAPNGTTMTASMLIWKNFWEGNRFGYASALAFVLTGVMLSLTWIQNRISEGRVFYG
jgi:multiple sugar transport system permease protein